MQNTRFFALSSLLVLGGSASLSGCLSGSDDAAGSVGGTATATGAAPSSGGNSVGAGGGQTATGGSLIGAGGITGVGGGIGSTGGAPGSGSSTGVGGGIVSTGGAVGNAGGDTGAGGGNTGSGGGPDVDAMGRMNARPGDTVSAIQDYLRMGEVRILNNNWGSAELGCNDTTMSVFVKQDRSFGWNFNRKLCGGKRDPVDNSHPDFPQLEFGIHPFGIGSDLATSPEFSSTTLLPLQLKNITSASVTVDNLNITLTAENSWNITFEFWLSETDPLKPAPGVVYAELMTFWGWQANRWPDSGMNPGPTGPDGGREIASGGKNYKLWVQDDNWADGKWRYFQFRDNAGPQRTFNGKVDLKPFIDYLVNNKGYSQDLWVTRMEVGSEIDDNTAGEVTVRGVTFEVNGQNRSQVIAE
jgi:Glycosyl hydrolase family 12